MRKILVFISMALCVFNAFADDVNAMDAEIQDKEAFVQQLKDEISQIDSEMARCERVKKNWKAATIVGGIGTVATGTAAIIQSVKLKKQKSQTEKTDDNK